MSVGAYTHSTVSDLAMQQRSMANLWAYFRLVHSLASHGQGCTEKRIEEACCSFKTGEGCCLRVIAQSCQDLRLATVPGMAVNIDTITEVDSISLEVGITTIRVFHDAGFLRY